MKKILIASFLITALASCSTSQLSVLKKLKAPNVSLVKTDDGKITGASFTVDDFATWESFSKKISEADLQVKIVNGFVSINGKVVLQQPLTFPELPDWLKH